VTVAVLDNAHDPTGGPSEDDHRTALVEMLRTALVRAGARESRSDTQDGFYFVDGEPGTVCMEYSEPERDGPLSRAALVRRRDVAVLNCCAELARHGYAFSLFLSPRTLTLTVRTDC